jgi:hypothetical protein
MITGYKNDLFFPGSFTCLVNNWIRMKEGTGEEQDQSDQVGA